MEIVDLSSKCYPLAKAFDLSNSDILLHPQDEKGEWIRQSDGTYAPAPVKALTSDKVGVPGPGTPGGAKYVTFDETTGTYKPARQGTPGARKVEAGQTFKAGPNGTWIATTPLTAEAKAAQATAAGDQDLQKARMVSPEGGVMRYKMIRAVFELIDALPSFYPTATTFKPGIFIKDRMPQPDIN
jgi:hypothetical protein